MKEIINNILSEITRISAELQNAVARLEHARAYEKLEGISDEMRMEIYLQTLPRVVSLPASASTAQAPSHAVSKSLSMLNAAFKPALTPGLKDESELAATTTPARKPTQKPASPPKKETATAKGKRTPMTPALRDRVKELDAAGNNKIEISKETGLSYPVVLKILKGAYDAMGGSPASKD